MKIWDEMENAIGLNPLIEQKQKKNPDFKKFVLLHCLASLPRTKCIVYRQSGGMCADKMMKIGAFDDIREQTGGPQIFVSNQTE